MIILQPILLAILAGIRSTLKLIHKCEMAQKLDNDILRFVLGFFSHFSKKVGKNVRSKIRNKEKT